MKSALSDPGRGGWRSGAGWRLRLLTVLGVGLATSVLLAEEEKPPTGANVSNRGIEIFWTDSPPRLDGRMDDACWGDAAVADGFLIRMGSGRSATEPTEVRVCYDAERLYVFWKVHESQMDRHDAGPAPDLKDEISEKENVQVWLDPYQTRQRYFQFAASPRGAQADGSKELGRRYDAPWQAVRGEFEEGWTMEMAIPFTDLLHPGERCATPRRGEVWGINFCRVQAAKGEESQWSLTGTIFGNWGALGSARFSGRRAGPPLPAVRTVSAERPFFGEGTHVFGIEGGVGPLRAEAAVWNDGREVARLTEGPGEEWRVPYRIPDGGLWDFRWSVAQGVTTCFVERALVDLPRVRGTLSAIENALTDAASRLEAFRHPSADGLRARAAALRQTATGAGARLQKTDGWSRSDWEALLAEMTAAEAQWAAARFDLNLIRLLPADAGGPGFAVGYAAPDAKIYPDTIYGGSVTGVMECAGAGREYESFQLVVLPFWRDLTNLTVRFTDLRGGHGVIASTNLSWFRVDYVRMVEGAALPREPDILMPGAALDVPQGSVRSVWVDVFIPPGTPAGRYAGEVSVAGAGREVRRALEVEAFGFDIPATNSIRQNHWFAWSGSYNWDGFYGYQVKHTPEMFERHIRMLARYRAQLYFADAHVLYKRIAIVAEPDGRFTFDFSGLDPYMRLGKQYHADALWASFGCNLWSLIPFFTPTWPVLERATGATVTMDRYAGEWIRAFNDFKTTGRSNFEQHPVYRDYLKAWVAYLKTHGLLDRSYFEIYDEPYHAEAYWLDMIRHQQWLKEYVPELKLHAYGVHPLMRLAEQTAVGVLDTWSPQLHLCDDRDILRAIDERRSLHGEEFWFYTCSERQGPGGGWSPHVYYDRPYLGVRLIPWLAWKLRADGFLVYCLGHSHHENNKPAGERWPNTEWQAGKSRGGGTLVYPGPPPDAEAIPSMRLANLRDGMEDYELFHLLRAGLAGLDAERHSELIEEAGRALAIEPNIIAGVTEWTQDIEVVRHKRQELAALIRRVRSAADPVAK